MMEKGAGANGCCSPPGKNSTTNSTLMVCSVCTPDVLQGYLNAADCWQQLPVQLLLLPPPLLLLLMLLHRMVVSNDFDVQFNSSAKTQPGLSLPPYRYNVTSRPRCIRAAVCDAHPGLMYGAEPLCISLQCICAVVAAVTSLGLSAGTAVCPLQYIVGAMPS
jgi:hypothetical protein